MCIATVCPEKKYKSPNDFATTDDYARYVRENISVGIMVRCCEAYEEVRMGDVGRVMKVRVLPSHLYNIIHSREVR